MSNRSSLTTLNPSIGTRDKKGDLPFISEDLQLLANLFGDKRIVWFLRTHPVEVLAQLVQRKVSVGVGATVNVFPDYLFPGPSHRL